MKFLLAAALAATLYSPDLPVFKPTSVRVANPGSENQARVVVLHCLDKGGTVCAWTNSPVSTIRRTVNGTNEWAVLSTPSFTNSVLLDATFPEGVTFTNIDTEAYIIKGDRVFRTSNVTLIGE